MAFQPNSASNRIITISREFGSGGRTIGKKTAEKLGIPCYDAQLIQKIAEESGFAADYVRKEGEDAVGGWIFPIITDRTMGMTNQDTLWVIQRRIILELAEKGPCVIVGRNADYILKDRKDVLNVYLHADIPSRVARVLEANPDEKNPEGRIAARDKRRRLNYQHYTGRTWGMSQNYHSCLDTSVLGIEQCAEIILNAVRNSK